MNGFLNFLAAVCAERTVVFEKHKEDVIVSLPGDFSVLTDIGVRHIYSRLRVDVQRDRASYFELNIVRNFLLAFIG